MSELDELERDLEEAAAIWFSPALHAKVKRVIAIARAGEKLFEGVRDATARLDRDERQADNTHVENVKELRGFTDQALYCDERSNG